MQVSTGGPIFVVGMPRSGTTLMRSIMNAHPSVAMAPETHFVDHWMRLHRHTDVADPGGFARLWGEFCDSKHFRTLGVEADELEARIRASGPPSFQSMFTAMLEAYAERIGKPRLGEKTPGNYRYLDTILEWFPDGRVLFMIRDPRAVVASFQALDREWTDKPVDSIAVRWRRSVEMAEGWARDQRVLLVPYEALAHAPEPEVRRICDFLDEPFAPEMLQSGRGVSGGEQLKFQGEVTTESVERWRTQLSPRDIAVTEHLARAPMRRWGYQPSAPRLSLPDQVALDARALWRRVLGRAKG
ncbi:MAG: sulfotransferase family protein [Microthrixaceae bacterium]